MIAMGADEWGGLYFWGAVLGCCVLVVLYWKRTRDPKGALLAWATQAGLELLEVKRRHPCGAFTPQYVYRIRVRDARGAEQSGLARVGGTFGLGQRVKVDWNRED